MKVQVIWINWIWEIYKSWIFVTFSVFWQKWTTHLLIICHNLNMLVSAFSVQQTSMCTLIRPNSFCNNFSRYYHTWYQNTPLERSTIFWWVKVLKCYNLSNQNQSREALRLQAYEAKSQILLLQSTNIVLERISRGFGNSLLHYIELWKS